MDGFDDELSDGSSSFQKDEPPTLDETIFDNTLFGMFLNYMKSQQAVGNLMFLKAARKFRLLNEPRQIVVSEATKLVMNYFVSYAPYPVTASEDVKKKLTEISIDPSAELALNKDTFSVAFGEVYNAVVPHFRNWISTEEWRDAIPFHRLPPPGFNVVLTSSSLRVLFNKFLKAQLDRDSDGSAAHAYHLWKFCLIANDFREGKYNHESHLDSKKKKRKGEAEGSDAASEKSKDEDKPQKAETPEEYAKRIYKKYKHQISLPYDKTMPHAVFIVRALDRVIEEFDKSALFSRWINLKQYQGVDYQAKVVHQTLTAEGYAEPPTLAAALCSSILPAFLAILQGTEQGLNVDFLAQILMFHQKFKHFDPDSQTSSSNSSSESSGSGKSRKDMIDEAKRIFSKFLEKGEMYCDPGLVEEVRNLINKNGGKGCNPSMFRKTGTFIYQRSEHTWCREARATYEWVNKSYDNQSKNTRAVEEEFSMKNLPEKFDLQIVPSLDDIYGNPDLFKDYIAFVDENTDKLFSKFLVPFKEYFSTPIHARKPALDKILTVFKEASVPFPVLAKASDVITKEVTSRERVSDTIVYNLVGVVARTGATIFYKRWLVEHSMVWKTAQWSSLPVAKLSDLTMLMGMSAVETQIEEAALKGKTGFSRYLAKRQLKKQSVANVRAATASSAANKPQEAPKGFLDMLGGTEMNKSFEDKSTAFFIPSIYNTFSSLYLRKLFERVYLETALNTTEMSMWEAFFEFYKKYVSMSNEELCDAQDNMRKDIIDLCDKYKALIPNSDAVKDKAKKVKIVFPHFFRPVEMEIYGKIHADYEAFLRKNGWK